MDFDLINEALSGALESARMERLEAESEPEHISDTRAMIVAEILMAVMQGEDDAERLQTRALRNLVPPRVLS